MSTLKLPQRLPWEDRFNVPTAKQLRDGLQTTARPLFDKMRKAMLELDGVEEHFAWYGDSWRWAIEYRVGKSEDPLAMIVPAPEDFQVAVPLDLEFIRSLPLKRMKRAVRDGIDLAAEPFDTRWAIWSVTLTSLLEDLRDLIELKHQQRGAKVAG